MEENNNNPEVKVSGKKPLKKAKVGIISAAVATVAIITTVVVLLVTGKLNFTKSAKTWKGIEKIGETFTEPIEDVAESSEAKISKEMGEKPIECSAEITASIDEFEIEGMPASYEKNLEDITDLLDGSKINLDLKADPKEKAFSGNISASVKDVIDNISAEMVYKDDTLALRSKKINEDYIKISKEDLEDSDYEEYAKLFDILEKSNVNDLMFTDDEIKHFEKTYKNILKDQIKDMEMESESDEVKINGKNKKCTKIELTITDSEVADILNAYIKAFKDDDKGREIIEDKVIKIAELYDQEIDESDVDDYIDEYIENLESVVDELEFDGEAKITTYATALATYRTDVEVEIDGNQIILEFLYEKDKTTISLKMNASGVTAKLGELEIINEKDNKELNLSVNEELIGGKLDAGLQFKKDGKKYVTSLNADIDINDIKGTVNLKEEETRNTDKKDELDIEDKLTIDVDVPDYAKAKGSITLKSNIKTVKDVDIPDIKDSNSVNMFDEDEMEQYVKDAKEGLTKLQKELENSSFLKKYLN